MKELEINVRISATGDCVSLTSEDLKAPEAFRYTAFFDGDRSIGYSMQSNNSDPDWPEMREALFKAVQELRRVKQTKPY